MIISVKNLSAFRSTVFIGLGSNLDNPAFQVQTALPELDELQETALVQISSLYETLPVGITDQPKFINAVARVETLSSPHDLLKQLREIEQRHGRVRRETNGPRTLDLDILIFNEWRIEEEGLITPHPRLHERAFVLVPLMEIAPDVYIPGKGYARDYLAKLDTTGVKKLEEDPARR